MAAKMRVPNDLALEGRNIIAQGVSPGNQAHRNEKVLEGRQKSRLLSPLQGFASSTRQIPRAYALSYYLSPLTGLKGGFPGFTLTELVVVLGIIAFIASISIGAYSKARQQQRLSVAADKVRSALELAKDMAISNNTVYEFQLVATATNVQVSVYPKTPIDNVKCVNDEFFIDTGITVQPIPFTLDFNPDGSASQAVQFFVNDGSPNPTQGINIKRIDVYSGGMVKLVY